MQPLYAMSFNARYLSFALAVLCLALFVPGRSSGQMAGEGDLFLTQGTSGDFSFSFGLSSLLVNAEGKEYVYEGDVIEAEQYGTGIKVSDLRWETENAWLLGGEVSMQYKNRAALNLGYWKRVASGSGTHTDDDWTNIADTGQILQTNYSEGRSELDKGSIFDLNADLTILNLKENRFRLKALGGYKTQNWKWEEHNSYGIYFYETENTSVAQDGNSATGLGWIWQGTGVGITYEQEISMPYIGMNLDYQIGERVGITTYTLYSKWVDIDATDHHLNRDLTTKDSLKDGEYWAVGLNLTWNFHPKWTFVGGVVFEEIETIKGDSRWDFPEDQESTDFTYRDGAGAGYTATTFTFHLNYAL